MDICIDSRKLFFKSFIGLIELIMKKNSRENGQNWETKFNK